MKKKDIHASGLALALTLFITNIVCFALVLVAPDFALTLFGSFMHGIDLTKIAITPTFGGKTILGFVVVIIGGYLVGVIYAIIYNAFKKEA